MASLPSFCICLCSKSFSFQSLYNHLGFQERQITSSWQETETTPSRPSSWWTTCQLTINPDNNSGTSPRTRTEIMTNQFTSVTELFNYAHLCPLPPVLYLFKLRAHVCTPKMAKMSWVLTLPLSRHVLSPVINLLSLPSPRLFIWLLGAGGWIWHVESQEFERWVIKIVLLLISFGFFLLPGRGLPVQCALEHTLLDFIGKSFVSPLIMRSVAEFVGHPVLLLTS
jgi:hypothetical protein